MNCRRGSVCQCHCGSLLIFNEEGKVQAADSSRYSVPSQEQQLCIFFSYCASLYLKKLINKILSVFEGIFIFFPLKPQIVWVPTSHRRQNSTFLSKTKQ